MPGRSAVNRRWCPRLATAVGALAGLVPALIAVRVTVIDAIRF